MHNNTTTEELKNSSSGYEEEIMQPVSSTANVLNPLYRGYKLIRKQLKTVKEFLLENLEGSVLDQWANYINKKGIFSKLLQKIFDTLEYGRTRK